MIGYSLLSNDVNFVESGFKWFDVNHVLVRTMQISLAKSHFLGKNFGGTRQQLNVSCSSSISSTSGSDRQATNDGFKVANINRIARKMSTMRITGKPSDMGCRVMTGQELLDYRYSRNIMPKSLQVVSDEQSRTKSFKICCDRENFVNCFDDNIWPDASEVRKYNTPVRSGRLFDNTAI